MSNRRKPVQEFESRKLTPRVRGMRMARQRVGDYIADLFRRVKKARGRVDSKTEEPTEPMVVVVKGVIVRAATMMIKAISLIVS